MEYEDQLLTDTEAAIYLGITKELLYSYVRYAPKGDRKLISIQKSGNNFFRTSELNAFDQYLKEPWSKRGNRRPEIPVYIKRYLDTEIGGHCPVTGKGYPLEYAHIVDYSKSLNHHHHNLIKISKEAHTKTDNKVLDKKLLAETKERLIESNRQKLRLKESANTYRNQAPRPNHFFIGRTEELIVLAKLMESERLVIIQGLGGIGKTQLLLNAIQNVTYHNPLIWIDVESVNTYQDLVILLTNAVNQYLDTSAYESLVEALKCFQMTIVFDSLEQIALSERDQIEDLIQSLITQTDTVQILATSQVDLTILDPEKSIINLKGISTDSAKKMLKASLPSDLEISQDESDWLINFCNGHPLSIKLVRSLLLFYKNTKRVVDKLSANGDIRNPIRSTHNKTSALEISLSTIYNCLTQNQKSILECLQFYPAGMKYDWVKGSFEMEEFDYNISILRQFFLLDSFKDSLKFERVIVMNPVVHFLKNRSLKELGDNYFSKQREAFTKLMMEASIIDLYYIESGKYGSPAFGIARIEDELPNLLNAFRHAENIFKQIRKSSEFTREERDYMMILSGIASALGKYCFTRDRYQLGLVFARVGIDVNLKCGEIEIASTHYMYLAQIQSRQYDINGFSETVQKLGELAQSTKNPQAQKHYEWANGRLHRDKGLYDIAMQSYQNVLKLYEEELEQEEHEPKNDDFSSYDKMSLVGNISLIQSEIADIYNFIGEHQIALEWYENVLTSEIELKDKINLSGTYNQYANCLASLNRDSEAIEYYFKAIQGFQQHGQWEYLSNSLSGLGSLSESNMEIANNHLLNEDVLTFSLESISNQFVLVLRHHISNSDLISVFDKIPHDLIGKIFNITKLVSLSAHRELLCSWAQSISEEFDLPQIKEPHYFTAIINLAFCVGGVDEWRALPDAKPRVLRSILQSCLIINGGPDLKSKTRVFYWLASWMRFTKLDEHATAETLWDMAWESFN